MARLAKTLLALSILSAAALTGCSSGDESTTTDAICPEGNSIGGVCAGVPAEALCDGDTCPVDSCSATTMVANDGELAAALAASQPGSCVTLVSGNYEDVVVPSGVRLLGKGADFVTVSRVELAAGSGSMVRGLTVGAGGLHVMGTTDVEIDAVRVSGTTSDGIEAAAGSRVTVSRSEITGAGRYSIGAMDAAGLTVQATVIELANGPGIWVQCANGCDCASEVDVTIADTVIRNTKVVGLSLVGVHATVSNVVIRDNSVNGSFQPGGGASISGCSVVEASGLSIVDNTNFGLLVDDSSATFQPASSGVSLEVTGNLRGVWLQHIGVSSTQQVLLDGATVSDNEGVGLGISDGALGVTLRACSIANTSMIALPVKVNGVSTGAQEVGDGLNWLDASQVVIDGLTVSNSARASLLIDGEVGEGSTVSTVSLSGGDEAKGIVQQNLPEGGRQPTVSDDAPSVDATLEEMYSVAEGLSIPPGI